MARTPLSYIPLSLLISRSPLTCMLHWTVGPFIILLSTPYPPSPLPLPTCACRSLALLCPYTPTYTNSTYMDTQMHCLVNRQPSSRSFFGFEFCPFSFRMALFSSFHPFFLCSTIYIHTTLLVHSLRRTAIRLMMFG